ncbi:YggS family pyridoxal phosphate enzyme [Engelhardtia mirabilis]|uniref:Pyridoxal phosphate homeostasis protein n=1 Tax=Engelhardtia mirabilis TaxID=2528011 RepID=A0A518BJT2_9BACT|nr:Pyridoxal phosphate homeostasis protein [Planctomycetes bacterium Pla133]QDV01552.1 Pyridoxal phosphate homeostasis protein [Planctomycetes bacterium Pla86]
MALALAQNLERVRARIERARRTATRSGQARLLAVTKSVEPEVALALARLGQLDLGENRPEGLEAKRRLFDAELESGQSEGGRRVRWHFIGHLQRNKARRVARLADEIHAVDSVALARTLSRVCAEEGLRPRIYLQVRLTDEATKHGLDPSELPQAIEASDPSCLDLAGLMTMAPLEDDPQRRAESASRTFGRLAELAERHGDAPWIEGRALLSMGMSDDLEQAVDQGSDWLRIGSALFVESAQEARR